jgi:hypothetical protein
MNKNPRACAECRKALEDFQKALSAAEEVELELSKI